MADYPTAKTDAVDNSTDVLAKHLNNIEDKLGIGASNQAPAVNTLLAGTATDNSEWAAIQAALKTWDGWIEAGETFVYVSVSSLKIEGKDVTANFPKGTKIKLTNDSAVKYYYVSAAAFSTDTTLTLAGEVDLASDTITLPYYSYADRPQGFKRGEDYFKAKAYLSAAQENLSHGVWTKINLDAEEYDPNSNFDVANYKYVVPVTGTYHISLQAGILSAGIEADKMYRVRLYVNGVGQEFCGLHTSYAESLNPQLVTSRQLTKDDYLELYVKNYGANDTSDVASGAAETRMVVEWVGL